MENHSYGRALTGKYTASLAATYPTATDYHAVSSPSLPNYLALTSGNTWGITDDGYHRLPAGGLGAQLTGAGIEWRAYMEGMNKSCFDSGYPYALKHNPFAYYGSSCPQQVVPFTQFAVDIKGNVPQLAWITPGLCHDGHDCSTGVADQWLSQVVPTILASSAWRQNGLLLITWDEGDDSANHVLTLAIHPNPAERTSSQAYNHYSLLATIEDRLGVPRLGLAQRASAMTDLLASTTTP
jgi:phosphatidylinositol-3-phosphatase